ncbi:unnamed protein product [Fraxinus pennsylvanica]|uniref:Uncharacterized protein n=1 Tax=Fraxinus pennsylvanica TaxID=56036 RepID=A0AAD1YQ86_9LAMI|nr:unnamed protein product [Fraxinus pennsylvanica]
MGNSLSRASRLAVLRSSCQIEGFSTTVSIKLFEIEGDYIHLREGAQEIIAATSSVARVAAAPSSCPTLLPSVAVTPMAQPHRLKVNIRAGQLVLHQVLEDKYILVLVGGMP